MMTRMERAIAAREVSLIPAASAGAMYFRSVLRSTPRLWAISFFDRPACQCIKISVTSITSNVLLAIGLPSSSRTGGRLLLVDGQVHHDTHAIPMGNYVIGVGNYVIVSPSELGNYVSADTAARETARNEPATPEMIEPDPEIG
jgi:hypothetical protein